MSLRRIKLGLKQQKTFMRKILKGNIPEKAIIQSCMDTCDDIAVEVSDLMAERTLMAKLASDTPQFNNPLVVADAKKLRDEILKG